MKNKLSAAISAAIPFILLSTPIHTTQADSVKLTELGGLELSITANRRAQPTKEVLAAITVITREDIERLQAVDIYDVLRLVPSVTLKNNGGMGKTTSIHIRGTNTGHALVLIDGMKIGSATLGSIAFENISLDNVERIEVINGSRSSLYGSEAVGGVIQIITSKGKQGFHPKGSISIGSFNTQKAEITFSGAKDSTWYNFNVGSLKTEGSNNTRLYFGSPNTEIDKDGYSREQTSLNIGRRLSARTKGELRLQMVRGVNEFDNGNNDTAEYQQQTIASRLDFAITNKTNIIFKVGESKDETENFKAGNFFTSYNTKRDVATLQVNSKIGPRSFWVGGVDWQNDKINTSTQYTKDSRKNTALFTSYQNQIGKTQYDISLRQDDNEVFGKKLTGNAALGYSLNNGLRFSVGYGTAFKAPTFNDLYYPEDDYAIGDLNIGSESSENFELGIQGRFSNSSWKVGLFENKIDNLIVWEPKHPTLLNPFGTPKYTPTNVHKAKLSGAEVSYRMKLMDWNLNSSFNYLETSNGHGKELAYRPKHVINIDMNKKFGKWNIGSTLHAESKRYKDLANVGSLSGFATLDLRTKYQVDKDWNVNLKIGNILNKEYETSFGYGQDGRNGMLSVQYSPK